MSDWPDILYPNSAYAGPFRNKQAGNYISQFISVYNKAAKASTVEGGLDFAKKVKPSKYGDQIDFGGEFISRATGEPVTKFTRVLDDKNVQLAGMYSKETGASGGAMSTALKNEADVVARNKLSAETYDASYHTADAGKSSFWTGEKFKESYSPHGEVSTVGDWWGFNKKATLGLGTALYGADNIQPEYAQALSGYGNERTALNSQRGLWDEFTARMGWSGESGYAPNGGAEGPLFDPVMIGADIMTGGGSMYARTGAALAPPVIGAGLDYFGSMNLNSYIDSLDRINF